MEEEGGVYRRHRHEFVFMSRFLFNMCPCGRRGIGMDRGFYTRLATAVGLLINQFSCKGHWAWLYWIGVQGLRAFVYFRRGSMNAFFYNQRGSR